MKAWGALPEAGGLRDQPAGMLQAMTTLLNVYKSTKGYLNAKSTAVWAEQNPEAWEIYAQARTLEKALNNG